MSLFAEFHFAFLHLPGL